MIFVLTMNMPSAKGNLVHQVYVEHPAADIGQFIGAISEAQKESDFFVTDELYKKNNERSYNQGSLHRQDEEFFKVGETAINISQIGKIRELKPNFSASLREDY